MNQNKTVMHGDITTIISKLMEVSNNQPYGTLYNISLEIFPSRMEKPENKEEIIPVTKLASRWGIVYKTVKDRYPKGLSIEEVERQEKELNTGNYIQKTTFSDFFEETGRCRRSAQTYLTKMKTVDLCGRKFIWIGEVENILKKMGYNKSKEETMNYLKFKEARKLGRI